MMKGKKSRSPQTKPATQASSKKTSNKGAANTSTTRYLDTFKKSKDCYEDRKAIKDKCRDDSQSKQASKDSAKRSKKNGKLGNITDRVQTGIKGLDGAAEKAYGYKRTAENGWVQDHCDHLWLKPSGGNVGKFNKQIQGIKSTLEKDIGNIVEQAGGVILDKAKDAAIDYGTKAAARQAASLSSLVIPGVGEVVVAGMTIFNIADGVWSAGKTAIETSQKAYEAYQKIDPIRQSIGKIDDLLSGKTSPTEVWADAMEAAAEVNPCLQARRCQLVPYGETTAKKAANSGQGCCPGQTGHHLLPEEMFRRKIKVPNSPNKYEQDPDNCPDYSGAKHKEAPTVCVEGVNNSHGSHGGIHGKLAKKMDLHRRTKGDSITTDEAIDKAVESHNEQFKPPCDPKCLKKQLHDYYDDLCQGKLKPRGGMGKDIEEGATSEADL